MTRLRARLTATAAVPALILATVAGAFGEPLDTFGIIAASEITNSGVTLINGNIALYPGTSITGFAIGQVNGTTYSGTDAQAQQAQSDLQFEYNSIYPRPVTQDLTGSNLGGLTLVGGVYGFDTTAGLTGTLTLDGQGNPNSVFIFNIGSSLTTAANSNVLLTNGANGDNVYFVTGAETTLGADSTFNGKIIAYSSISLGANVTITCGAAWARTAAVTIANGATITSVGFDALDTCGVVAADAGGGLDDDASDTAEDVADALDGSAGPLPPAFQDILDELTGPALAAALAQLSGEAGTGAAAAGTQSMDSFLSTVFDSAFADDSGGPAQSERGPDTVKALGYASTRRPSQGETAIASFDNMPDPSRWGVWAAGYGGASQSAGDADAGTHDLSATNFGAAAGFDRQVTANTKAGFVLGGGGTSFSLADGFGGGNSSIFQAAVYQRTNFNAAYVATAVAYAYNAVSTERHVVIPLPPVDDTYTASYGAHNVAGQIEVGYRRGFLTPYAALRGGAFITPAYDEEGPGEYGLSYEGRTAWSLRSELGARVAHTIALHERATLTLSGRAAWAHDYLTSPSIATGFIAVPDATFEVEGAQSAHDWLLLSAGAKFGFGNGLALSGLFDGAFAENAQTWSGTARVSYHW